MFLANDKPIATKHGQVVPYPPEMTQSGNGCYWPCLVDMSDVPNFPYKFACYFSTDHTGTTDDGIYLYLTNNINGGGLWKSYTQSVQDGEFDYLSSKPSANPIYVDNAVGSQTETPHLMIINGTIVLTYQNSSVGTNQSTVRALGSDGINFSRDRVIIDYVPNSNDLGDGHTGYFRFSKNPFNTIPYQYIGYSLYGGTDAAFYAQWGTDDPVDGDWVKLANLQSQSGRIVQSGDFAFEWNLMQPDTIVKFQNRYFGIVSMMQLTSGANARNGAIYEVEFDNFGREIISHPRLILGKGNGFESNAVNINHAIRIGNRKYRGVYEGVDSNNDKTLGCFDVVVSRKSDPILPAIPALTTNQAFNFKGVASLPSGLSVLATGAANLTFGADGTTMNVGDGEEIIVFFDVPFDPSTSSFIDVFCKNFRTISATRTRQFNVGFISDKTQLSSATDGVIYGSNGTSAVFNANRLLGGSSQLITESKYPIGYNDTNSTRWKQAGIRWFSSNDKMYQLGMGKLEIHTVLNTISNLDKTKTYYPFISLVSVNGSISELVEGFEVRCG